MLRYLHRHDIIHLDVKPDNVIAEAFEGPEKYPSAGEVDKEWSAPPMLPLERTKLASSAVEISHSRLLVPAQGADPGLVSQSVCSEPAGADVVATLPEHDQLGTLRDILGEPS